MREPKAVARHAAAGVFALAGTYRRLPKPGATAQPTVHPVAHGERGRSRSEQLSEAVVQGRQARLQPDEPDGGLRQPRQFAPPTPAEQMLMASLGIQFDGQAYRFAGYRYDRLADAVRYARQALGPT